MWIQTLRLKDFRGFKELELDLNRQLTVLIGVNGSGKSSIVHALDAMGRFWGGALKTFLSKADVRVGADSLTIRLAGSTAPEHWIRFSAGRHPTEDREVKDLVTSPTDYTDAWQPRVRCLHTGRTRSLHRVEGQPPGADGPATSEQWFRAREDIENELRVRTRNLEAEDPALGLVRRALAELIPGIGNPHVERDESPGSSTLVFEKGGERLSSDMLSDGEKSLVALAIQISSFLHPTRDVAGPLQREATIVIDEVELHLHPRWQRLVVPRLLRAFPSCQFVVTTHSPQVLGSVELDSILLLEDFNVYPASHPTRGRDSNAMLEEVMGATARDPATENELDEAARLVEVGSNEEAEAAVEKLAARFGDDDREVVRLRTALMLRGA